MNVKYIGVALAILGGVVALVAASYSFSGCPSYTRMMIGEAIAIADRCDRP
jgi:hypothetical protein